MMKSKSLTLLALAPIVANALPRAHQCGRPPPVTTSKSASASIITVSTPNQVTNDGTTYISIQSPNVTGIPSRSPVLSLSETSTYSAISIEAIYPTPVAYSSVVLSSTATSSETSRGSAVVSGVYSEATPVSYRVPATQQCGSNDRLVLPGMPWTVANSLYNADQMVGSQCTNFEGILEATDGTQEVQWNSVTDIELVDSTKNLCKGYTNIGIGVNLNKQLGAITAIPAYFKWNRTNTTEFRGEPSTHCFHSTHSDNDHFTGSNVFDFITAPTSGDTSSTATSEFMLWFRIWGNQVPIGFVGGAVATFDLFGASWKLYEGKNPDSGVTVRSMLVDENFDGEFQGDLKFWLDAMVQKGYMSDSDYVTVGNAGTELFYGNSIMNATVVLNIQL
jgi:xyloglucan-specific endo-beta-1,4-glucanase